MKPFICGSRGSALALTQTRLVLAELRRLRPDRLVEIRVIKTEGDRRSDTASDRDLPLGKGIFTQELEQALLSGVIDLAIHSLKDLPTTDTPGLKIAAIPKRADARDVLVTRDLEAGQELPLNAIVATGSPRRTAQLHLERPDLAIVPVRGNIDTRLRKLRQSPDWSALVLAAAGLERLKPDLEGLDVVPLDIERMLPAPGQGALAIQTRVETGDLGELLQTIHDPVTAAEVRAERMFLHALGGGCREPIAAHAQAGADGALTLRGIAWLFGEAEPRQGEVVGRLDQALQAGVVLAAELSK